MKGEEFLQELKELLKKYKITVSVYEHYDGDEQHCGSSVVFEGIGVYVQVDELEGYYEMD